MANFQYPRLYIMELFKGTQTSVEPTGPYGVVLSVKLAIAALLQLATKYSFAFYHCRIQILFKFAI